MTDTRFDENELFLLTSVPSMIGSAVAVAGGSGVFGTVKEAVANAKSVMGGVKGYPDNAIIQAILPSLEDRKEALEHAKEYREKVSARMKQLDIDSREKLIDQLTQDCNEVAEILNRKASAQEAKEYKEWAMSVAEKVAMSAKEGGFLGFGGERVSSEEKETVSRIASALGTVNPFTNV